MKGNVKSKTKILMYPRFVQAVLNEFPLQPHKRVYNISCLKPKVFQNMDKASTWVAKPLFPQMLAKISRVQGEDATIPVVYQSTPTIQIPSIDHTPQTIHTYGRRHKQPTPFISKQHVPDPHGVGTSSGGSRLPHSPTRMDSEQCPIIHLSQQVIQ